MAIKKTNQELLTKIFATVNQNYAKISDLEDVKNSVGESNVIEGISVNGEAAEITDKVAAITVPTETTIKEIAAQQVAESGHASIKVVDELPSADEAESNILYFYKNETTGYYDIYALIDGAVVLLDDTSLDMSGYSSTEEVQAAIDSAIASSGHLTEADFEEFTDAEIAAAYEAACED